MVRLYGEAPYKIVLVHGGPGAIGSLKGFASELIEHIILIGCAPLEDKYVSEIGARRFQNLSEEEEAVFQRLIDNQTTDEDMKKISDWRITGILSEY